MLIQFPGSSSLPPALARALGDEELPAALREALRGACADDEEDRLLALDALQTGMTLAEDVDDADGEGAGDVATPPGLRLFPALAALASLRDGPERLARLGIAGGLEMMRLAAELDIPEDLGDDWEAAHADALRMCADELASPADPEVVRPLLACLATLQGDVVLAGAIASFDDEDGDDDGGDDDEGDDEAGDDDDEA